MGGGVQNRFWEGVLWYVFPPLSFHPPFVFSEQSPRQFRTKNKSAFVEDDFSE